MIVRRSCQLVANDPLGEEDVSGLAAQKGQKLIDLLGIQLLLDGSLHQHDGVTDVERFGAEDVPKGIDDGISGSPPEIGLTAKPGKDSDTPLSLALPQCAHRV
ncbi:MAG: hypothetical protein ACRDYB_11415 [Acidimicrobiales bacterium]